MNSGRELKDRITEKEKYRKMLEEKLKSYDAQIRELNRRKKKEDEHQRKARLVEFGEEVEKILEKTLDSESINSILEIIKQKKISGELNAAGQIDTDFDF